MGKRKENSPNLRLLLLFKKKKKKKGGNNTSSTSTYLQIVDIFYNKLITSVDDVIDYFSFINYM